MDHSSNVYLVIAQVVHWIINAYSIVLIISILMSWFRPDPNTPGVRLIYRITEPLLYQVRRIMPKALFRSGLDFTPIVLLLILRVVDRLAMEILFKISLSG